jgi:Domain of unknown function (DUF4328)
MRPGVPSPRRRHHRQISRTPRYPGNPGWTLGDPQVRADPAPGPAAVSGAPETRVRSALKVTQVVLAVAAVAHVLRYILLIVNRDILLRPVIADAAVWFGVAASVAALAAVIGCGMVLTRWLIARRAAVFAHLRRDDPRSAGALWAGCLVPVVNLVWAPVFVIETAAAEGIDARLRKPITVWWVLWLLGTVVAVFAIATSFTTDGQGIADNTVTATVAYVLAFVVVGALSRVHEGFVCKPVDRPAHRWVVVGSTSGAASPSGAPAEEAQAADRQPAA